MRVVGISLDPDAMPGVAANARSIGIRYRVATQRRDLVTRFKVRAVPTTLVIAADRTVVFARAGVVSEDELRAAVHQASEH